MGFAITCGLLVNPLTDFNKTAAKTFGISDCEDEFEAAMTTSEAIGNMQSALHTAIAIDGAELCIQRPVLIRYSTEGKDLARWPGVELDEERDADNDLILEMPCPWFFPPKNHKEPVYAGPEAAINMAKKLWGKFLRRDYDYAAGIVMVTAHYYQ